MQWHQKSYTNKEFDLKVPRNTSKNKQKIPIFCVTCGLCILCILFVILGYEVFMVGLSLKEQEGQSYLGSNLS